MHRIAARDGHGHQRMADLVMGDPGSIHIIEDAVFLFEPADDSLHGFLQLRQADGVFASSNCEQRRFIQ